MESLNFFTHFSAPDIMSTEMRQRFRVKNDFFAAETYPAGDFFEVKVFLLKARDGYFKEEGLKPVLHLRGDNELDLLRRAMAETKSLSLTDEKDG